MNASDPRDRDARRGRLRQRALVAICMGVLLVGGTVWFAARWSADAPPRWNLVLITLDTTRADHLGCYGYRRAETPTIDGLAREAVRYESCYTPMPLTLPAHCSLLTGLTPPRHGIRDNGRSALADEAHTHATEPEHGKEPVGRRNWPLG